MSISTHLATAATLILLASAWTAGCRDRTPEHDHDAVHGVSHNVSDGALAERTPAWAHPIGLAPDEVEECGGYADQLECTEHLGEEACSHCSLEGDCSDCTGGSACEGCPAHDRER